MSRPGVAITISHPGTGDKERGDNELGAEIYNRKFQRGGMFPA